MANSRSDNAMTNLVLDVNPVPSAAPSIEILPRFGGLLPFVERADDAWWKLLQAYRIDNPMCPAQAVSGAIDASAGLRHEWVVRVIYPDFDPIASSDLPDWLRHGRQVSAYGAMFHTVANNVELTTFGS